MATTTATPDRSTSISSSASVGGPIGRVVAVALALGMFSAVGLVVMFPGLSEPALVGGILLSFAAGWAALAGLSARFTHQTQRWAVVPAGVLTLAGAALIIAHPGEPAMTVAAWLWGPGLVVLAVFVVRQARRTLPRRGRVLVHPLAVVTAMAGIAGLTHVAAFEQSPAAMPGRLVDVGDHRLHLSCVGSGSPTVVLLNGLGETSPLWGPVQDEVSATSRVCTYDRAGQGWSDDSSEPADAAATAADLHRLLDAAGEPGPFVLAGHSTGGVHALRFTAQYPDSVAAVVLLDSSSPRQPELVASFPVEYKVMRRVLAIAPTLMRLGVGDVLTSLAGDTDDAYTRFTNSPRGWRNQRAEQALLPTTFEQAQVLASLDDRPLVVVTAKQNADNNPGWATAQHGLAHLSTNARHLTVDVDHSGLLDNPAGAQASIDAITAAVHATRFGHPSDIR